MNTLINTKINTRIPALVQLGSNLNLITQIKRVVINSSADSVVLSADIYADSINTVVTIEYGLTGSYGSSKVADESPIMSRVGYRTIHSTITGLTPFTIYHFRVKTENANGIVYSDDNIVLIAEKVRIDAEVFTKSNYNNTVTPQAANLIEIQSAANAEKIVGGNFESGLILTKNSANETSTWTLNTTLPISGTQDGLLAVTSVGTSDLQPELVMAHTGTNGKWHKYSFAYKINSGVCVLTRIGDGLATIILNVNLTGTGVYEIYLKTTNAAFKLYFNGTKLFNAQFDLISAEQVGWTGLTGLYNGVYAQTAGTAAQKTTAALIATMAYSNYDNNIANKAIYGVMLSGYAKDKINADILLTAGYGNHIPTELELKTIALFGGYALRESGTSHWATANGTDELGFKALNGGYRSDVDGSFSMSQTAFWCGDSDKIMVINDTDNTATIVAADKKIGAYIRLVDDDSGLLNFVDTPYNGYGVQCISDDGTINFIGKKIIDSNIRIIKTSDISNVNAATEGAIFDYASLGAPVVMIVMPDESFLVSSYKTIDTVRHNYLYKFTGINDSAPTLIRHDETGQYLAPNFGFDKKIIGGVAHILLGFYGPSTISKDLILSTDNGNSFTKIYETGVSQTASDTHIHDVEIDTFNNLLWCSVGDGTINARIMVSSDNGATWNAIQGSDCDQPTTITSFSDRVVFGSDSPTSGFFYIQNPQNETELNSLLNGDTLPVLLRKTAIRSGGSNYIDYAKRYGTNQAIFGEESYPGFSPGRIFMTKDGGLNVYSVGMRKTEDNGNIIQPTAMDDQYIYARRAPDTFIRALKPDWF